MKLTSAVNSGVGKGAGLLAAGDWLWLGMMLAGVQQLRSEGVARHSD